MQLFEEYNSGGRELLINVFQYIFVCLSESYIFL
jgi:hypothetical protein